MRHSLLILCAAALALDGAAQTRQVELSLVETTDVHGNYFPYDFINGTDGRGSLARVQTYVQSLRSGRGADGVVLLDNGDILQGQPTAYFYNFIDTRSPHLCASMLNYMGYDAGTVGNHDVEAGHAVYDRWAAQCDHPVLAANVTATATGLPYWKPYTVVERQGVRIAVLGLLTPAIPQWLPEGLWAGLRFDDMVRTARRFMPQMREEADVVVGLFHSGTGEAADTPEGAENAALAVAREVPGFDVVFCGHDHRRACLRLENAAGDSVWVLNPAAGAEAVAQADVQLTFEAGRLARKQVAGRIVPITGLAPDTAFLHRFAPERDSVMAFTSEVIGYNEEPMETAPAFFGPSAFIDFIHQMQLSISGADISFAAPLAFDARVAEGEIRVRDLFNLYRYENLLYVMELTGREVKDYLEYSYAHWTQQMRSADDHLLRFRPEPEKTAEPWQRLEYPSYNFDSAAGIRYTVDVTRPEGEKVTILEMADGRPFSPDATYRCAVNSYRGNGGGGLLTEGAHIPKAELPGRTVWTTEKDLRYYLLLGISRLGVISPAPLGQWKFVPEDWAAQARLRDEPLLH